MKRFIEGEDRSQSSLLPPPGTGAFRTSEGWVESAPPGPGDVRTALSRVESLCADTGYRRTTPRRTGRSIQATVARSDMADSVRSRANPRRNLCRQRPVPARERPLWPREPRQRLLWRCATSHPATSDMRSYSRARQVSALLALGTFWHRVDPALVAPRGAVRREAERRWHVQHRSMRNSP
jgi:hypothetical protein